MPENAGSDSQKPKDTKEEQKDEKPLKGTCAMTKIKMNDRLSVHV